MSLDLHKTVTQIDAMSGSLKAQEENRQTRIQTALHHLKSADPTIMESRRCEGKFTWLVAGLGKSIAGRHSPPPLPDNHVILAADGSHIDIDRNSPARCYLINTGHVFLRYGSQPQAILESEPRLYADDLEMTIQDPDGFRDQSVEGPLLGIKRAIAEVKSLVELVAQSPTDLPTVALLDGSLILWGLGGQAYPEFVRKTLLDHGLLEMLDALQQMARHRTLALASYISFPRSTDVINALRLAECPYPVVNCDRYCRSLNNKQRPCAATAHGLTDRDLFANVLALGQRTDTFRSTSSIMKRYKHQAVSFFYMNVGEEIARVEIPAWVACDQVLSGLLHAALLDQCKKGHGYPVALSEAHEQAVITGPNRNHFRMLVEESLGGQHLPVFTSEKDRSKRSRWV